MLQKCIFCLATLISLALTGCNTIQGAGQDVEHAGRSIQNEAQEHKHY
jgi:predicted small secreted protein